ncbi:unnamed protein product [Symbiodinium microadriaticum]|nr:unnamed protein product [Symbiodinium microadriaticum]
MLHHATDLFLKHPQRRPIDLSTATPERGNLGPLRPAEHQHQPEPSCARNHGPRGLQRVELKNEKTPLLATWVTSREDVRLRDAWAAVLQMDQPRTGRSKTQPLLRL